MKQAHRKHIEQKKKTFAAWKEIVSTKIRYRQKTFATVYMQIPIVLRAQHLQQKCGPTRLESSKLGLAYVAFLFKKLGWKWLKLRLNN